LKDMRKQAKRNIDLIKDIYSRFGMWIILLGMVILMASLSSAFLSRNNIMNLLRQISFISIIGFGSAMILISGNIDLSPGALMGLVSVVSASFAAGERPVFVSVIIGLFVGLAGGAINGFLITRLNVPPFIATLGVMSCAKSAAVIYTNGYSISGLAAGFKSIGGGRFFEIPIPFIIMISLAVIVFILLNHTPYGRHVVAIGNNEQAAKISGVRTDKVVFSVYVLAGVLSAVAGILMTGRVASGQALLGVGYEFHAISAAVVGGVSVKGGIGSIWGVICGALVIGVMNNGMDLLAINTFTQEIARGAIIVIAVILDQLKYIQE